MFIGQFERKKIISCFQSNPSKRQRDSFFIVIISPLTIYMVKMEEHFPLAA